MVRAKRGICDASHQDFQLQYIYDLHTFVASQEDVSLIIFLLVTLASGYLRPGTLTSSNIVCILRLVLCILRARILYYTIIYNNMHNEDHGTQVFLE